MTEGYKGKKRHKPSGHRVLSFVTHANPINFVFVWVPVTQDKVMKVQEPLPSRLIKQQQEVDS